MATTQNTYTGNGSTVLYSFTFPYLETDEIKVSLNGTLTTAYTLANATTISFNTAPANGAAIRIYRETDNTSVKSTFFPGSAVRAQDLNTNFLQALYVSQESDNESASATATANTALTNSAAAVSTSNTASANATAAVNTANTASGNAASAVTTANNASSTAGTALSTANTAATNASTALSTANTAISTSNTASSTANTALAQSSSAVSTANTASSNASAAVTTANTASANSTSAVTTANNALTVANTASTNASAAVTTSNAASSTATAAAQDAANAIAAVSAASLYVIVAAVANIPTTGLTNNQGVQVIDTTGLESFTPLSGKPAGFVGSSALYARIRYSTSTSSWVWVDYAANDPENRYLPKTGGTLTGALTLSGAPSTSLQAATKAYVDSADATLTTAVSTAQSTANSAQTTANAALPKAGGTMTGAITLSGAPTVNLHAATKAYVDAGDASVTATANAAQTTANTAVTNATAAQSTANTAVTNAATAQTTANNALPKAGGTLTGDLTLNAQSDLRFADADSSNWVGFQAPSTVTSNVTWTLPATDASVSGYALKSDGAGNLSWGLAGGALGGGTNQIFYENDTVVSQNYTISSNKNAMTAGPVTINSGVTVTVPSGSAWSII